MASLPFRRGRRKWNLSQYDDEEIRQGQALANEAEAFLAGRLADHLGSTGRLVPGSALLNRLAHGTPDELRDLLAGVDATGWRRHPSTVLWTAAERTLALRLLRAGPTEEALRMIQSEVLVPLEFSLMARSPAERLTPAEVVRAVTEALDAHLADR